MAIGTFHGGRTIAHLTGTNENQRVDIEQDVEGVNRMAVNSTGVVSVEQLFGKPGFAGGHFAIGTYLDCSGIGAVGDTIRIQIVAGCNPSLFPAVDVTYTIVAGDIAAINPETEVRDKIIILLNADVNFKKSWEASKVRNNGIVFITALLRAEVGDRGIIGDFVVSSTGTTVVTQQSTRIVRENTETELARSIDDPRQGILGITGSITIAPGALSNRVSIDARNGGSNAMNVNGTLLVPIIFSILADPIYDLYITEIRLHGVGNGIRFERFLNLNSSLVNGLSWNNKSDDLPVGFETIKTTDDLKSRFSSLGGWNLSVNSGGDHFLASKDLGFVTPLVIRKQGSFPIDDLISILVRDSLNQVSGLFLTVHGFRRI